MTLFRKNIVGHLLTATLICFSGAAACQQPAQWQIVASDSFATVLVERQLYSDGTHTTVFVHVRIDPTRGQNLSVDMRDPFKVFYPNQWTVRDSPNRAEIDEERISRKTMTDDQRRKVMADFQTGALTPVGRHFDYYRAFFGAAPKPNQLGQGKYLIISMDGEIVLTNGRDIDVLTLEWTNGLGPKETDIVLNTSSRPKRLPTHSKIIAD